MKRVAMAAGLAVVEILAAAPPAQADVGAFLDYFHGDTISWIYGPQRLVDEGYRVCQSFDGGMKTQDAVWMVETDLSVPRYSAVKMVTAARQGLGCLD
ncbi:DUF732 domain-containing protein [Mycolicibacterium komossense]|uniref:DUF732 domain-containing protein n=1 Tax=Mycolicibacterium komossense TaxID=1779 RepID=A0ABT3CG18_9MYCO|nr:DUF732 domain-containing protein [Mycolicibacterium komossense]MCV7228430.1 DUF732 domain-containing protein [Mycolicibacterium komossense]